MYPAPQLQGKRVLVCICGGVAAYKVCEVISTLVQAGFQVRAVLTAAAQRFIAPLTVATLCRHAAHTDESFWSADQGRPLHIDLAEWADLLLLAPLSANTLAKVALGLADNLLTNTILAASCPVLVAPAMNTVMWQQPTVQQHWQTLAQLPRFHQIGPAAGRLACDAVGTGRMAEPAEIVTHCLSLLLSGGHRDLQGKAILVTAGGTREYLDPVRFLGNPATGKMGVALAYAAYHRGAQVNLVQAVGEENPAPMPFTHKRVGTASEMRQAVLSALPQQDWVIMAAAVADVRPRTYSASKIAKQALPEALLLEPVPDILLELSTLKQPQQRLIGFAAQTGDIVTPALEKLQRKGLDAIVANPIDQQDSGFAGDRNEAIFIDRSGHKTTIPNMSKLAVAHRILDLIGQMQ